jgi:hypothetical protein
LCPIFAGDLQVDSPDDKKYFRTGKAHQKVFTNSGLIFPTFPRRAHAKRIWTKSKGVLNYYTQEYLLYVVQDANIEPKHNRFLESAGGAS